MNPESSFFSSLLNGKHTVADLRQVERGHLTADYQVVYDYVQKFVVDHKTLPRAATVEGACRVMLPPSPEGVGYYSQQIRDNALRFQLDINLTEKVAKPLSEADPHAAVRGLGETITGVRAAFPDRRAGLVLDDPRGGVRQRLQAYHIRAKAAQLQAHLGLPLPWEALNRMTGGLMGIWYILARPNIGKTWVILLWAVYLWQLGYDVFVCSMETPPEDDLPENRNHRVIQGWCRYCYEMGASPLQECPAAGVARQRLSVRLDALAARLSPWRFLNGCLTPHEYQRLVQYYTYMEQGAPAWGRLKIVSAPFVRSLTDYELECRAFNGDVGLIDSGYLLMRGESKELRIIDKATELVIGHKMAHGRLGVPGVMSWHFNANVDDDAIKAGAAKTIMYTDEISRAADVMFGLFRPPEMQVAGEALGRSLKVRDGLALRELKFYFRVKEDINFGEIAEGPAGRREQESGT